MRNIENVVKILQVRGRPSMNLKTLATFAWQQLLLPKVKVVSVLTGSGILYALALQHIDHIVLRAWLAASPKLYEALCHRIALGMAIASTWPLALAQNLSSVDCPVLPCPRL
jgi:hypothetical protein